MVDVPARFHHPVWIEDPCFDLDFHLRRIAIPAPGGQRELDAVVADVASHPLDRRHPLWEIWQLEGLADGGLAYVAKIHHALADGVAAAQLLANIMAGLPGAFDRYDLPGLRTMLARFRDVTPARLRANLARFLHEVVPTAEEVGIRMAIHPDDPPWPLLGLPRVASSEDDLAFILGAYDSPANGLTLCTGSLGARPGNDLPAIAWRFAERIHFAHLRNVRGTPHDFAETWHDNGDLDLAEAVRALAEAGFTGAARPDHAPSMAGEPNDSPGYEMLGRLFAAGYLRGLMQATGA